MGSFHTFHFPQAWLDLTTTPSHKQIVPTYQSFGSYSTSAADLNQSYCLAFYLPQAQPDITTIFPYRQTVPTYMPARMITRMTNEIERCEMAICSICCMVKALDISFSIP